MVTHIVFFKLKDRTPENARQVQRVIGEMKGKIPGLLDLEVGVDFTRSERSFDVALITRHATRADLDVYQVHPVHERVKEYVVGVRESSVAVDFEN